MYQPFLVIGMHSWSVREERDMALMKIKSLKSTKLWWYLFLFITWRLITSLIRVSLILLVKSQPTLQRCLSMREVNSLQSTGWRQCYISIQLTMQYLFSWRKSIFLFITYFFSEPWQLLYMSMKMITEKSNVLKWQFSGNLNCSFKEKRMSEFSLWL